MKPENPRGELTSLASRHRRRSLPAIAGTLAVLLGLMAAPPAAAQEISPAAAQDAPAAAAAPQFTPQPVRVLVNGREIAGGVLGPAGRVLVPMRPLFEAAGAELYWDEVSRSVRAFYPGHSVTLQAGSRRAWVGGEEVVLDQEPVILDGRLYVPLRFVGESLSGTVSWDGGKGEAHLTLSLPEEAVAGLAKPEPPKSVVPYTDEELDLLVRVINAEAYDEPYLGKVAVGAVIVNRVKTRFSNATTIKGVLLNHCQFAVVCNGAIERLPLQEDSRRAALEALQGADPTHGAVYFNNLRLTKNLRFWNSLTRTVEIGSHTFFKD